MKDISQDQSVSKQSAFPFALAQSSVLPNRQTHQKLAGFAKVLAGGRVTGLNNSKPFADRMLADGVSNLVDSGPHESTCIEQMILESVATNLKPVKLLDKQELILAKIGGRLSEMALSLNHARSSSDQHKSTRAFDKSRSVYHTLCKTTFDHTALFSNGPSAHNSCCSGEYSLGGIINR